MKAAAWGNRAKPRWTALVQAANAHPARWLFAAFVLNFASYKEASTSEGTSPALWVLLDLWLFWRVRRGGTSARFWLLLLGGIGLALQALFSLLSLVSEAVSTGQSWRGFACACASLACLSVPALNPERRPFGTRSWS